MRQRGRDINWRGPARVLEGVRMANLTIGGTL